MMASLFCLTSSIAGAQIEISKPVSCFPIQEVLEHVSKLGGEPKWIGTSQDGATYFALVTGKDNSWVLLQFSADLGCIIGSGYESKMIFTRV